MKLKLNHLIGQLRKSPLKAAVVVLLAGLIFAEGYYLTSQKSHSSSLSLAANSTAKIVLTPDGFSPSEITIPKGTTVTFTTTDTKPFWPASDLHPSHLIYPEFDPKKPIPADKSWSFTFDKVGTWPFHDHLFPAFRGKIIVTDQGSSPNLNLQGKCQDQPLNLKQLCWNDLLDQSLKSQGLDQAFDLMNQLYQTEPAFASDCHDFAHKLGEAGYHLYAQGQQFNLTDKTAYCGYGFFHGFLEELLKSGASLDQAGAFCQKIQATMTPVLADACYHGMGHGATSEAVLDPSIWGNPQKIIDSATTICQKATNYDTELFSKCASGLFMELGNDYIQGLYHLQADQNQPFKICESQIQASQMACYTQMNGLVSSLSNGDLNQAVNFIKQIPDKTYAIPTMQTTSSVMTNVHQPDLSKNISACRQAGEDLHLPCIQGLVLSFMLYGNPGQEYVQALNFCQTNQLTPEETNSCQDLVLSHSKRLYDPQKFAQVCSLAHRSPQDCLLVR